MVVAFGLSDLGTAVGDLTERVDGPGVVGRRIETEHAEAVGAIDAARERLEKLERFRRSTYIDSDERLIRLVRTPVGDVGVK